MASEITFASSLKVLKGSLLVEHGLERTSIDMAGDAFSRNVQSIPTSAAGTAVVYSAAVTTLGVARFKNLDSTNYIELGVQVGGTFYPFVLLKPTDPPWPFRLAQGITLYARSNTSACLLDSEVFEN